MKNWKANVVGVALGVALVALRVLFPEELRTLVGTLVERPYLMFLAPLAMLLAFLPRYRRSGRLHEEALRLLAQGRTFAALEKFEDSRRLARRLLVPTLYIVICRVRLWQLAEAERELEAMKDMHGYGPPMRESLLPVLSLVAALGGRTEEAAQRLEEAKKAQRDGAPEAVLAEAVLACRRGHWGEARAQLERQECYELAGSLRGMRDLLLAWSLEQLAGSPRPVELLSVFGESSVDTLRTPWPELHAYVTGRMRLAS